MPEPIDSQDFAGPHPTCREFVAQLIAWGSRSAGMITCTPFSAARKAGRCASRYTLWEQVLGSKL